MTETKRIETAPISWSEVGKKALEVSGKVFDTSMNLVLSNADRIAGVGIALGAMVATIASGGVLVSNVLDVPFILPIGNIFGDAPQALKIIDSAAMMTNFALLHIVGKNIATRNPAGPYDLSQV